MLVADKLSAAGWSWGIAAPLPEIAGAGSLTLIATMVAATSFILMSC
jgi:hypothetical protein